MNHSIYIVDDNPSVREALVFLIENETDLQVCGTAETAFEALAAIPDAKPDLVITDLSLPQIDGIELVARLRVASPGQRMVIISGHMESDYATRALEAGAHGCILKGDPAVMMNGIRQVLNGRMFVSNRG